MHFSPAGASRSLSLALTTAHATSSEETDVNDSNKLKCNPGAALFN